MAVYFSPEGQLVSVPFPDGSFKIVANVSQAPPEPDVAFVQQLLDARGPQSQRAVVRDVIRGSRFRIHHGVAERFHVGRVALAGDSAHDNSPLGGQGMNTGVGDAVALARALDAALANGCGEAKPRAPGIGDVERMLELPWLLFTTVLAWLRPRQDLVLENLLLRHHLVVLTRTTRTRPRVRLRAWDKLLWILARRFCAGWPEHLMFVTPDTVVRWHRHLLQPGPAASGARLADAGTETTPP